MDNKWRKGKTDSQSSARWNLQIWPSLPLAKFLRSAFRIPRAFPTKKRVLSCPGTRARLGSETWPEAGARSTTWRPGPRGMLIARARCCKCEGLWGNIAADCAALASWCDLIIAIRAHFAARFPQRPFCPHRASNLGFGPAFRTSVPNPNPLPFPPLTAATP